MQLCWQHRLHVYFLSEAPISVPYEEEYMIDLSSGTLLTISGSGPCIDLPCNPD